MLSRKCLARLLRLHFVVRERVCTYTLLTARCDSIHIATICSAALPGHRLREALRLAHLH
jgi:hypothetical protein